MFYDKTRKGLPFNTGDCLIEMTGWTGLTVYIFKFNHSRVIVFQYAKKKVPKFKKSHSADDQSQQHFPDPKTKGRDTMGKIYLISVGKKWNVKNSV